ncbi:hypothetical protein WICPIJ_006288, partial [Wickerhamomyces pijperi]
SKALDKLAVFSLNQQQQQQDVSVSADSTTNGQVKNSGFSGDILKLSQSLSSDIANAPITHKELEILFALAKTAPFVKTVFQASDLLKLITPYLSESPQQLFRSNISLQLGPSPWDHLTETLVNCILELVSRFPELEANVENVLTVYLDNFKGLEQYDLKLSQYFSLLGFIRALVQVKKLNLSPTFILKIIELFSVPSLDVIESVTKRSLEDELDACYLLAYRAKSEEFCSLLFTKYISQLSNKFLLGLVSSGYECPDDCSLSNYLVKISAQQFEDGSDLQFNAAIKHLAMNKNGVERLVELAQVQLDQLDNGATYINLSSKARIDLAYQTKANALQTIGVALTAEILPNTLVTEIVANSLSHLTEVIDYNLAPVIISLGSLLNFKGNKTISSELIHSFPLVVSRISPEIDTSFISKISKNLALGMKPLSQDSIITTIYSLINLLSEVTLVDPTSALRELKLKSARANTVTSQSNGILRSQRSNTMQSLKVTVSNSSLNAMAAGREINKHIFKNSISAVIEIAKNYDDHTITVLALTVLTQKFTKVSLDLDLYLLEGLAEIAPFLSQKEFVTLTRMLDGALFKSFESGEYVLSNSIGRSRIKISQTLSTDVHHPLFKVYLLELLNNAITRGDVQSSEQHRSHGEISEVAKQITTLIKPLAALLPRDKPISLTEDDIELINSFRNFWFNLVVHGYSEGSALTETYKSELEIIAFNSPPLASDFPRSHAETSFELNTVLRRGSSNHNVKDQKHIISGVSNTTGLELHALSYPKLMFLSATSLLENLRANTGNCSTILQYFSDESVTKTSVEKFIGFIAISITNKLIKLTLKGKSENFTADVVAAQVTKVLILCCHRNSTLQDCAFQCANLLLNKLPSALCHHQSLYTLLDLLTLLFDSLVDINRNKYEPKREFFLKHSHAKIIVSDSEKWRSETLERLRRDGKKWCLLSLSKTSQDMKSLLQGYVSDLGLLQRMNGVEFGVSFAIQIAGSILPTDLELANMPTTIIQAPNSIAGFLSQYSWRAKNFADKSSFVEVQGLLQKKDLAISELKLKLRNKQHVSEKEMVDVLDLIASILILRINEENSAGLVHELVSLPFQLFTSNSMKVATNIWLGIIKEREDDLSFLLLAEIVMNWERSIKSAKGLFSKKFDLLDEDVLRMTYSPTDRTSVNFNAEIVSKSLQAHAHVIRFFSSHFQGTMFQSDHLLKIFTSVVVDSLNSLRKTGSLHPFARVIRSELIKFGFDVLQLHLKTDSKFTVDLIDALLNASLSWFVGPSHYPFGSNALKIRSDFKLLGEIYFLLGNLSLESNTKLKMKRELAIILLKDELTKTQTWLNCVNPTDFRLEEYYKVDSKHVQFAFELDPLLALRLVERYPKHGKILESLIASDPSKALDLPQGVKYYLRNPRLFKYLILSKPIGPTDSIILFQNAGLFSNPFVIQYNMRSLESHDVNLTFFYVPQIVQSLRNDAMGYVGRFIVETGKVDQLFAHQIIWNMLANSYKDEDSTIEDSVKPQLDAVMTEMIASFSAEDRVFYETEFKFFNEVTGISGKLKPYIKKTKAEKKVKIDEEMNKIQLAENVYLPSNPDGVVVDINRNNGKPLQSHAKAPFMATFKVRKDVVVAGETCTIEKWQSAIFKVGDDCRQDVLALQLISIFKSVWDNSGLDLYVFPYRVTATAPGCGVIDVLPNSISRDMLGREAVNGLYEYFITKFGNENSSEFELARNNFIKSLAAYSVISYLLQFKDRHNGNIMYDDQGHVLHIDFGFCFDIVPGGVKFEAVPFKLTKEMVRVMGGSSDTESFKMFEELFIKGFLAMRPYSELIVSNVITMLGSGLPCFKGEKTIRNLRNRFFLDKDDKQCIHALKGLIRSSYESMFTVGYDKFQKITNGIPY